MELDKTLQVFLNNILYIKINFIIVLIIKI